jgi:hypothetical protein
MGRQQTQTIPFPEMGHEFYQGFFIYLGKLLVRAVMGQSTAASGSLRNSSMSVVLQLSQMVAFRAMGSVALLERPPVV